MNTDRFVDLRTIYTDDYIGAPTTPGNWVSDVAYIPITRLRMSCGVGGAQWFEYIYRIPLGDLAEMKTALVTTWDGKRKLINMRYVVEADEYMIAQAVFDNMNPYYKKGEYLVAYLLEDGHAVSLTDAFL